MQINEQYTIPIDGVDTQVLVVTVRVYERIEFVDDVPQPAVVTSDCDVKMWTNGAWQWLTDAGGLRAMSSEQFTAERLVATEGRMPLPSEPSVAETIANGVHVTGLGLIQDGTITIENGRIVGVQQDEAE